MELKIVCGCGQKYSFDVEPIQDQMPFVVNCPSCGTDGTAAANTMLRGQFAAAPASAPAAPPAIATASSGLKLNRPGPAPALAPAPPPPPMAASPMRPPTPLPGNVSRPKQAGGANLGLGILGALLGAGLGTGLMYGFFLLTGFRFPLLGVGIGALTGLGAKLLYKGTGSTLGIISGAFALLAVVGVLFLIYGEFPVMNIISVVVSVSFAYRIASG
jgi:hypothetical protein